MIKCSFFNDDFMIAISTDKNLFEIGDLNYSLLEREAVGTCYKELKSIYNMIDYFKLDQKTGL